MDENYFVKRNAFACVCITNDFHGTAIVWDTEEDAWKDAGERVESWFDSNRMGQIYYVNKVYDGYEIRRKVGNEIVRCYKVFEIQELEEA